MEYKRLGKYIREVNVRNKDLKVTNLLGLSVSKEFMPSIANTIGTDMSTYKVVVRDQLVYIADTSRRGDKIAIALLDKYDNAIVSSAYTVFEIIDKEQLLPKYLMMWFQRPEFDRYARFHSHGSAREIFDWDELCGVYLPLPDIDRQREIVEEYETLSRRIRLNEQMIEKLEATAQALYRKMFVDGIDKENLPEGWRIGSINELCLSTLGGDWGKDEPIDNYTAEVYCVRGADIPYVSIGKTTSMPKRYILSKNLKNKKLKDGDIVIEISGGTPTQSTGRSFYATDHFLQGIGVDLICSNFCRVITFEPEYRLYLYALIRNLYNKGVMFRYENSSNGINNLDLESLMKEEEIVIPSKDKSISYALEYQKIIKYTNQKGQEIEKLSELQSLLLAKMGRLKQ